MHSSTLTKLFFSFYFQDNTISQSLGISLTDVDFGLDKDVPFWRKNSLHGQGYGNENHINRVKSDVPVTLNHFGHGVTDSSINALDIGMDTISTAHRALLLKLKHGPVPFITTKKMAVPLLLDRLTKPETENPLDKVNTISLDVKWNKNNKKYDIGNSDNGFKELKPAVETPKSKPMENTKVTRMSRLKKRVLSARKLQNTAIATRTSALKSEFGANADVHTLANVFSDISKQIESKQDVKIDQKVKGATEAPSQAFVDNTIFQNGE